MSRLGDLVREKREREGLSLRDAGEASGVAFSTLGRVENGGTPSFGVAQRIQSWLEGCAPILPTPPMTLRDWFAGQALPWALSFDYGNEWGKSGKGHAPFAAARAYAVADAMLAERAKAGGSQ